MRKIASLLSMLMLFSILAFAQTRTVTGTVRDSQGNPIPFATVTEAGTRNGVTADANGDYTIRIGAGSRLTITAIGYTAQTFEADNASNVVLARGEGQLQEVVVTALGIRRSEKALGYSVSKVDPSTVIQKSEPDLLKGLQGKVPGVDIRSSQGVPGSATRIQIRGNSSLGLETQPLIIVDGVPYSNESLTTSGQTNGGGAYGSGFANLDPNDIETFNVLKGAAAAALYGSRASRGVIVITTKSGSGSKGVKPLNVTFKSSASFETIANLPEYQNLYGTGAQNRAGGGSNGSWGGKFGSGNVYDAGGNVVRPSSSGVDSVPAWGPYLAAYPELFDANGRTAYIAYPNNVKDMFNTGTVYENSVNVNGGGSNSSFNVTLSNVKHNGYVENSTYNRNNIGIGGQTKYGNLTIGGNASFAKSRQVGGFFGIAQSFTTQFGRTLIQGRSWNIPGFPSEDKAGRPLAFIAGQYVNPIWAAKHNTITTDEERVVATFRAGYKVNNWININYTLGANHANVFRDEIIDEFSTGIGNGLGRIVEDMYRTQTVNSTIIASFNPQLGNDFSLDVKLGNDISQSTGRRQANIGSDFIVPNIFAITNTVTKSFAADDRTKRRIAGVFADATLGYRNFAFLNATARQDRTSTLPYKNATYFYPALSASLVWTDAFDVKSNWLDYGKVRASWARVGSDAPAHRGEDVFGVSTFNFLGQPFATRDGTTVDPDLTPEFTREYEFGTDISLFQRRVNLDFTYYDKSSTDLIYAIEVPVTTGYTRFFTNLGEISNKGVEVGLTLRPVVSRNFSWEVRGAFTKNENMVVSLVEGLVRAPLGSIAYLEPGLPYGYLRGTAVARDSATGQMLIDSQTGWPIEDQVERMIGNPNPDWKLGITNTLTFKGFTLSALWDMTKGGDFYSETVTSLLGRGVTRDTEDRETNRVIAGVYADPNNIYSPLLVGGKPVPNQTRISTNDLFFSTSSIAGSFAINGHDEFNVFDGTVYRLRELALGYNIPANLVNRLKLTAISLTLTGRNLWYLAPNLPKYTRYDPETNSLGNSALQGIELSAAPTTRRFGVNLNVTF